MGEDRGGGEERVGQQAGHLPPLRHRPHHRLHQGGGEGRVALEQPDGAGQEVRLRPEDGGAQRHHLQLQVAQLGGLRD